MFEHQAVREVAEFFYDQSLPYHNFGHILYVLDSAEELLAKCQQEQIIVDEKVVYYALLFHDAGYADDHLALGYETKEAYSAGLAEQVLLEYDMEQAFIDKVKQAILSTHHSTPCKNNDDKLVKSSDLSGLAADYSLFKENAVKLMSEYELLNSSSMEWERWRVLVAEKLEGYLKEDFSLSKDNIGNAAFFKATRENVKRLQEDELE